MLIEFIERLRERPEAARRRFALFTSLFLTGCIAAVWLSVLLVDPTKTAEQEAAQVSAEDTEDTPGIWARLRSALRTNATPDDAPVGPQPSDLPPEAFGEFHNTFRDSAPADNTGTGIPATNTSSTSAGSEQIPEADDDDMSGFVDSVVQDVAQ